MSFKVCVVGCGGLSNSAHGPSLKRYAAGHPDVELVGCCDLDLARAETYRGKFGFRTSYTDYRQMLSAEHPDAVCLMAPVDLTCQLSVAIMEMGFPLLMEKPPGLNREECLEMIEAAKKSGVPNQVSFNRRYTPLISDLRKRLGNFAAGEIQDVRYDFFRINRRDADFSTTAIHGIDTAKFLAGADYETVKFTYQYFPELGPTVANIFMECQFASGAMGHLNFCPVTGVLIERATVALKDHTFFLNIPIWGAYDSPGRLIHISKGEVMADVQGVELSENDPDGEGAMYVASGFYGENAAYLDDLRAGKFPVGTIKSGLQSVEIADCIRRRLPTYSAT